MNDITALTRYGINEQGVFTNHADGAYVSYQDYLALVEALKAEQKKSAKQGRHACELFDEVKQLQEQLRTVELSNSVLESRTVTVKLPEVRITVAESKRRNLTWRELGSYNEGADVAAEKISKVLTAAGIQVIEGEG